MPQNNPRGVGNDNNYTISTALYNLSQSLTALQARNWSSPNNDASAPILDPFASVQPFDI